MGGGGEIFNVRTNHNQQLAIGMDRYSVYDNENEGGRGGEGVINQSE